MSGRAARGVLTLIGCALGVLPASPVLAAAAERVDLELVLATDVSRSIDEEEATLQREGVADAFRSPEVVRAIQSGALRKIGVTYIDWSIEEYNKVVIGWRIVRDKASADAFAAELLSAPPTQGQRTSISGALTMAANLIETNALEGTQKTIDVSGDGPNNAGDALAPVRDAIVARGITINGLPIITEDAPYAGRGYFPEIDKYYAACVIGGRGSFVIVAHGFKDFATAIRHKLVLEVSGLVPDVQDAQARPVLIPAAAHRQYAPLRVAEAAPMPAPPGPAILHAPAVREQNCDRVGFGGFGGFGGFPGFGQ